MDNYLELHAPQWVDFTENRSPIQINDFFEKYKVHERIEDLCDSTTENKKDVQSTSHLDVTCDSTKAQADLNVIKSTPIKVVSPRHRNNKEAKTETTYEQVFNDAMRQFELCKKPPKIREALKTTLESNTFKTPNTSKIAKSSRSIGCHSAKNKCVQSGQDSVTKSTKVNKNIVTTSTSAIVTKTSINRDLFKQDENHTKNDDTSKKSNDVMDDSEDKKVKQKKQNEEDEECNEKVNEEQKNINETDNKEHNEENDKELKVKLEESTNDNEELNEKHGKELQDKSEELTEENKKYYKELQDESEESTDDNKELNEKHGKELQDKSEGLTEENKKYYKELQDESEEESTDDNKKTKKEDNQDEIDAATEKSNRAQCSNKHTVLTWHNHRRSLQKRKMPTNKKFVSLAEAVSRFQNETPERYRTRSSKANNMSTSLNVVQNRFRSTIPISPALVSKTRTRPVTVLSREEREKLELEEIKKHPIKANPIPPNILRGLRVTKATGVARKSTAVGAHNSAQSNEKSCVADVLQYKSPLPHRDKVPSGMKNIATKIVTDLSGIIVEQRDETASFFGVPKDTGVTKNVTRIMPFSFEARNKDLQLKKEQRLKSIQEASKTKAEFHARPVPNFSKPPTPPAKQQQQQQNTKKSILPCPFSFDDRNRKAFERKEQLVKQILEENNRGRIFRASPAPIFKPVMVRGRSKENLFAKNTASEQVEDQENREPNFDSSKMARDNVLKLKNTVRPVENQKAPLKACPPKLNTDKRAKDRTEFNEKMRRKEMEEEATRQEAEKKRLESEKEMKVKLRKLMEVKARPMPTFKSPMIIKATKQLTNPQSPAFASKLISKQT